MAGYVLEGYAGPTETWLALWDAARSSAERAEAHKNATRCLGVLQRFARMFPVGVPRAALCRGIYERIARRPAQSAAAFERSLAAAERLAMPYERGLAASELGQLLGPTSQRGAELLTLAYETFASIGAVDDARQALRRQRGKATA